jgi:hypothetical protein
MTTVVLCTPMHVLPYIDFSIQTPKGWQTLVSVSARSGNFNPCLAAILACDLTSSG